MKGFFFSLETLSNGQLRATGRQEGRTVSVAEGTDGRDLVLKVMRETAGSHRISGDRYSLTYIRFNPAARQAYEG